jgi:uncharacterized HAD superfamily protein
MGRRGAWRHDPAGWFYPGLEKPVNNRWMIDFDGVLAALDDAMIASCNEKFGTDYRVDEIDNWEWWSQQPKKFSDYVWRECYPSLEWTLSNVHPEPGAITALCDLLTDGELAEEAVIVTARKADSTKIAAEWLKEHLPPGVTVKIVSTAGYRKSAYCQMHQLDVVVDDHANNLRDMNSFRQRLYLVNKPYNAHELVTGMHRVDSLADAVADMAPRQAAV